MLDWNDEHINSRVVYTGRNGNSVTGVIKEYAGTMVNLKLDNSSREHFFVPKDTIKLVPDELGDIV